MTEDTKEKVDDEIVKLIAETAKINAEARFYPLIVTATILAGIGAFVKVFG